VIDYDTELRAHNERLRAAAGVAPGDHVLDIGCGAGQSTRDAARAAAPGRVLGVDVSAPMLERARRLTIAEQLDNVTYEHGDAQVHPFAPGHYDLAVSRFGAMFFSDPVAAFSNIARALRVGGRLVLLVWQSRQRNEWATAIGTALNGPAQPMAPAKTADAFSLGDRAATARVLERAGFRGIRFSDVREPVFYGHDVAAAMDFVRGFTSETLASLPAADAARALQRLRDTLHDHRTAHDGVVFDSRAWLITAHRR
jgi:ubiquinone/menaquinone biosynthesis C-methylase UbiE